MPTEMLQKIGSVKEMLATDNKGKPYQSEQNCVTVFENDPMLAGAFRWNEFTENKAVVKELGWERSGTEVTDADMSFLYLYLERFYDLRCEKNIDHALTIVSNRLRFHPVRDLLNSLQWDGQERIRYVLHHFLGAEISDLNYEVMKTFMLGAVERVFHPGCKFEMMLCIVGTQGAGKSTFFRFLTMQDEWFSDDLRKLDDKDVYRKMRNHWIIEMAEMLGTSSAKSVEEIKAFISRQKETYKDPYAKYPRDRPRQCVFVGTSNQERFLPLDRTGNRRFYPVQADSEQAEVHILEDPEASREYMRQLWAEIMTIYRNGGWSLRLSPEMEHQMDLRRMDYMAEDTATGTMQAWLDDEFKGDYVCTRQIYNECYKMLGDPDPKAKSEINSIMNNTIDGWERGPTHRFGGVYGTQRSWHRVNRTCKQDEKADQGDGFVKLSDEECRQLKIDEIFGK